MPRALQIGLMWIVSLAWVANLVIGYLKPALGQQPVNVAFMLVLAVMVRSLRRSRGNGTDEADDEGQAADALDDVRRKVGDAIAGTDRKPGDPQ